MIIAVCDPKGIAIEAIKTILYHDTQNMDDKIFVYAVYKKYDRQIFGNRELPVFNINLSSKPRP